MLIKYIFPCFSIQRSRPYRNLMEQCVILLFFGGREEEQCLITYILLYLQQPFCLFSVIGTWAKSGSYLIKRQKHKNTNYYFKKRANWKLLKVYFVYEYILYISHQICADCYVIIFPTNIKQNLKLQCCMNWFTVP